MHYPAPRINQALGIDPGASLDDALAAIAQLRAHVTDAANALKAANENARAGAERDAEDIRRMRLENNRMAADLETARAAHRFAERMRRNRDTAYAVLHHLTAEYAP